MSDKLHIDVVAVDGSSLNVTSKTIYGEDGQVGVGGAELALLTMCEEWTKAGHDITLYNNPREANASIFPQLPIDAYRPRRDRDVVIFFRAPTPLAKASRGLRVWWSCDQYSTGDYAQFASQVDEIVCISPRHQTYFKAAYGIDNTVSIDLPVRVWEYEQQVPKVPYRFLFSSIPDRGLHLMHQLWGRIRATYPEATLHITSDYRLWGTDNPGNALYRMEFLHAKGVSFLGAIKRKDFVREQQEAQILPYSCIYDELYCISVAEAQVAGAYPITSNEGALATTNMGIVLDRLNMFDSWQDRFMESLAKVFADYAVIDANIMGKARQRFAPERILKEWNEKVFSTRLHKHERKISERGGY